MTHFSTVDSVVPSLREEPLPLSHLSTSPWDVIVIGAGPAGCLSARLSALNGLRTLLIESKRFPRYKVCGGCLNPRALHVLAQAGLTDFAATTKAVELRELRLHVGQKSATISVRGGLSVSRQTMDETLLEAARAVGAHIHHETTAKIEFECQGGFRQVTTQRGTESVLLQSRVVVCADGLSRSSARKLPELSSVIASNARVGVGTLLENDQLPENIRDAYPSGTIVMTVARGGYIGIARAEQDRLSVAAAFDPAAIQAAGSPEAAVARGLDFVGLPWLRNGHQLHWHGTPGLTSHAQSVATNRIFVVGDAAGYVEPFTGEGMSAALESAWNAAPLIAEAVSNWDASLIHRWQTKYRRVIRRRQWISRLTSSLLRSPRLVSACFPCVRQFPGIAQFLIARINDQ